MSWWKSAAKYLGPKLIEGIVSYLSKRKADKAAAEKIDEVMQRAARRRAERQ